MAEKKRFVLIVCACLLVGIITAGLAEYFGDKYHLGWLASVGEGLIVAAVLAVTVDFYLKKHLTEAVIRDVSPHLMGADLPPVLRNEIHALCATEVIRRDLELDFIFRELPGEPDFIILTTKVQYGIENLSDRAQAVELVCGVNKPYKPAADFIQIETVGGIGFIDHLGTPKKFEDHATPAADLGSDEGGADEVPRFRSWTKNMYVPPKGQATETRFWSTTHQILPVEFQDAFISVHPTIGQTVRATYPDWMSVQVQFGHRLYQQAHAIPSTRPSSWRLPTAFPGRAATMIEWRKRPTPLPKGGVEEIILITDLPVVTQVDTKPPATSNVSNED